MQNNFVLYLLVLKIQNFIPHAKIIFVVIVFNDENDQSDLQY